MNIIKSTSLVIMAAGIGSRFGGGIKQLEPVGPNGEIIMDYSIHDALEAGFNKIVFIIRKDIEEDFRNVVGNRIEKICNVSYVFQEIKNLPNGLKAAEERKKPWGTGQAVLACKNIVKEPFVVINADDYYGKEAFVNVHRFLMEHYNDTYTYCMAGFILKNTLSENGGVTRGVCQIDEKRHLKKIVETSNIIKSFDGKILAGSDKLINADTYVSMNMWGLTPEFLDELETGFFEFLSHLKSDDVKSEYLLPTIIDSMIQSNKATVTVLETKDRWFGVTYREDKASVVESFKKLIAKGIYEERLFSI